MSKRSRRRTADLIEGMKDRSSSPTICFARLPNSFMIDRYKVWSPEHPERAKVMHGRDFAKLRTALATVRAVIPGIRIEQRNG